MTFTVVCAALAIGGHPVSSTGQALPGGPHPSGHGDPTPVARPGHRPHHAHLAGPLLLDHPGRPRPATRAPHHPAHRRLVREAVADLRGRHRTGATAPVAGFGGFFTIRSQPSTLYKVWICSQARAFSVAAQLQDFSNVGGRNPKIKSPRLNLRSTQRCPPLHQPIVQSRAANPDTQELPVTLYHRLVASLAYAA